MVNAKTFLEKRYVRTAVNLFLTIADLRIYAPTLLPLAAHLKSYSPFALQFDISAITTTSVWKTLSTRRF